MLTHSDTRYLCHETDISEWHFVRNGRYGFVHLNNFLSRKLGVTARRRPLSMAFMEYAAVLLAGGNPANELQRLMKSRLAFA